MKHSRIIILHFILFFLANLSGNAQESNPPHLVIWYNNNDKVAYELSNHPVCRFSEDTLFLCIDDVETIPLSSIKKLLYADIDSLNNLNVRDSYMEEELVVYRYKDKEICIQPLYKVASIILLSIDGKILINKKIPPQQTEVISLRSFNDGIYLIKINGVTHKIVKI